MDERVSKIREFNMTIVKKIIVAVAVLCVLAIGLSVGGHWVFERVYVAPDEALMVINKFGDPLPSDRVVVPTEENHFRGVEQELLGPGRYFLNPIKYDWKIVKLINIPAGDPSHWEFTSDGRIQDSSAIPCIGLVALKEGKMPPPGVDVVDAGYKGIQRDVLTPGTYKINPQQYEVQILPATVVPPGSVGVVTRLTGEATAISPTTTPTRLVDDPKQRGILKDVLQPGVYYLNPRLVKVTIVPIGYDAIVLDHGNNSSVKFYSSDGYQIEAEFTVVWGRGPADAPAIVANIGAVDQVRDNVIEPAMKAACQNEGARYSAKELIQGTTRSQFQDALSKSLEEQVSARNVHILLALIRNISVRDSSGHDQTDGLLATIQLTNVEVERDLTNQQETTTAAKKAQLETEQKLIEVAKQTVAADTQVKTATLHAEGEKAAAEIDAERDLKLADIEKQIAELDAQRTRILGQAGAQVQQLKNEAEAKGAKMLIDAFGDAQSYNLYMFAKNFEPTDLRMIFAGPGTFWTDLKSFQDVGASKILQQQQTSPENK